MNRTDYDSNSPRGTPDWRMIDCNVPMRTSSLRGLGAWINVYAIESFIDELAEVTGIDPVSYRLSLLSDPRARRVVETAANMSGWIDKKKPGERRTRGFGFARYKNIAGYCAVAMEVVVNPANGHVRVLRAVASADCGHIVNPDGVKNQIEGGLIQSLSWTLKEEIMFDESQVLSSDWVSYPILRFSEIPAVDVELIDRPGAPLLGAGEASQGPTAAALANAVCDATGARLRRIPFTPARVKAALQKKGA